LALLAGACLLFLTEAPTSLYRSPWRWGGQDQVDQARQHAADLVGSTEPVAASPRLSALVARRAHVVELPPAPADVGSVPKGIHAVLLDTTDRSAAGELRWDAAAKRAAFGRLTDVGFHVAWHHDGIYVLRR
jgi:hypothetical protein